ncbi:MAG: hypothetical protein IJO59_06370 [Clostridia bacterium]|nr:hypothetical protein [Clostridia bacterium]
MYRRNKGCGGYCLAFGIGVLLVIAFPLRFILIIAAFLLILAGLSLLKCG